MHRHRAVANKMTFAAWDTCVTPDRCAANPARQAAHGAVVTWDRCACGAVRLSESNLGVINMVPWVEQNKLEQENS